MAKRKPVRRLVDVRVLGKVGTSGTVDVPSATSVSQCGKNLATELPLRILGIDPGLGTTGYGLIEGCHGGGCRNKPKLLEAGIIRAARASQMETGELAPRLLEIFGSLIEIIEQYHPSAIALEALYSHYERPMTAVIMGHARGAICLAGAKCGIPVVSYAATQVKKILTGSGRANKEQMQRAVQFELNLAAMLDPPDVADATALAICHYYLSRVDSMLR